MNYYQSQSIKASVIYIWQIRMHKSIHEDSNHSNIFRMGMLSCKITLDKSIIISRLELDAVEFFSDSPQVFSHFRVSCSFIHLPELSIRVIVFSVPQLWKVLCRQMNWSSGPLCIPNVNAAAQLGKTLYVADVRPKVRVHNSRMQATSLDILILRNLPEQFLSEKNVHELRNCVLLVRSKRFVSAFDVLNDLVWGIKVYQRTDVYDPGLRLRLQEREQQISQVKGTKVVYCQSHLHLMLVSFQFIQNHACIVDENVNMMINTLDLLGKPLNGLLFG